MEIKGVRERRGDRAGAGQCPRGFRGLTAPLKPGEIQGLGEGPRTPSPLAILSGRPMGIPIEGGEPRW